MTHTPPMEAGKKQYRIQGRVKPHKSGKFYWLIVMSLDNETMGMDSSRGQTPRLFETYDLAKADLERTAKELMSGIVQDIGAKNIVQMVNDIPAKISDSSATTGYDPELDLITDQ